MTFSIKQAQEILEKENFPVIATTNGVRENSHPFDNYYQLIKTDKGWEYSLFMQEKTNSPEKADLKEFQNESDGAMYFLLKQLSNGYSRTYIDSYRGDLPDNLSINDLIKGLQKVGVSARKFVYGKKELNGTFIQLEKVDDEHCSFSLYVDGVKTKSSIPLSNRRGLGITFRKVILLYFFETKVEPILKREHITYGTDELVTFVFN
ncbi:hypothetical protein [Shouchella miscanthi]|uniref:hypothetical protein n=1 Tax=Shouchella miscanthi TaxID=2598861 RepID=UPI0011A1276B|nr:hypothetical protein [Shouchella miscanthi]